MTSKTHYYKGIQLPQLRTFCVAATEENFTAAAKVLGLSPPVVWQQVRALERVLATPLLRRNGRAVELTMEGRLLLDLVQPHVSGLDSLVQLFKLRQSVLPRQLTVAATNYFLSYHLAPAVLAFTQANPSICLSVRACTWSDVFQFVERGFAELGVAPDDSHAPRSPHLEYEDLASMQLMLLTAKDHPLARKRTVGPKDVVEYPLIMQPHGSHGRAALDRILQRYQISDRLHIVMELSSLDIMQKYVALGVGIAMVFVVAETLVPVGGVRYRPIGHLQDPLAVAMVVRKGAHLSEPLEAFREEIRKAMAIRRTATHSES
jgi:DNA-binding transcriptional LysR family regulator